MGYNLKIFSFFLAICFVISFSFLLQFIFSTATDGKIKAWLYDNLGSRVDYDAPGHSSTTMSYSADGTRSKNVSYFPPKLLGLRIDLFGISD